ncbi:SAM-dependent methyltransferase [Streptomyces sp. NPDC048057]|uniref:SAM-dependent methyltransferase n=1 Tax=Streptomyces sp. NPDC048057 TaxID=3155628 RepID=UPI0033CCFC52
MADRARHSARDRIDTTKAHAARVYDYLLGGKDHYDVDAEMGDALVARLPSLPITMRQNRLFMERVARYLAREEGVRQYLDIGTGLPTSPNLHELVQREVPDASVVYVDNDPIVLAHAEALLTSASPGRTAYVDADMREPESILWAEEVRSLIDLGQPVALTVIAVLHFIPPPLDHALVRRLVDPLPSGSFVALSMGTSDFSDEETSRDMVSQYERQGITVHPRTHAEASAFAEGLDLVPPGVLPVHHWRPDARQHGLADGDVAVYGFVARKP